MHDDCINTHAFNYLNTCPDGAVAMSLANGLVGTGFVSPTQKGFLKAQWALLDVSEREGCSGLTPTHWAFKNPFWVGDTNPVPTSPLANDIATAPSGQVFR